LVQLELVSGQLVLALVQLALLALLVLLVLLVFVLEQQVFVLALLANLAWD
jgi:hypothetical protein